MIRRVWQGSSHNGGQEAEEEGAGSGRGKMEVSDLLPTTSQQCHHFVNPLIRSEPSYLSE